MADANFWYESNGAQKGPITAAQLKGFAVSGELRPTDMIWKEGAPDWMAAGSVKGLFPEGTPGLAPPPPPAAASAPLKAKSSSQGMYGPAPDLGQATAAAKEASQEAIEALKILLADPIGGIAKAYESLGPSKALPVGIVFIVALFICQLILALVLGGVPGLGVPGASRFKAYFVGLFALAAMVGTLIGLCVLVRTISRSAAAFAADIFIVGVSMLPFGLAAMVVGLFAAVLKSGMFQEVLDLWVMVFGFSFTVFLLFSGITKIYQVSERAAALWAPLMLASGITALSLIAYLFML